MEQEQVKNQGLTHDGHDIFNAFVWGIFVATFFAAIIVLNFIPTCIA
ncbi:hypothetical protein LCGC14_2444640 [marine sediment metagenome]|uniref:Uncharacterized protein n=1 Tax=marine sediment metagenome TaxID=412755 RepID=A0A0F9EBT9_9ZZZZ